MKILIVDDSMEQLEIAKRLLSEHEIVTANGWNEARKLLIDENEDPGYSNPNNFDVVLTDMMMPGEGDGLGNTENVGKLVPYGFNVSMLALRCGVQKVAVVSNGNGQGNDGNHHQHPILWACDDLNEFCFESRLMFFTGYDCPYMEEGDSAVVGIKSPYHLKNWFEVLQKLTS